MPEPVEDTSPDAARAPLRVRRRERSAREHRRRRREMVRAARREGRQRGHIEARDVGSSADGTASRRIADGSEVDAARPSDPELDRGRLSGPRRRRSRRRTGVVVALLGLVAVAVVAFASGMVDRAMERSTPTPADATEPSNPDDPQPSIVLVTAEDQGGSSEAHHLIVLAYDRVQQEGSVVLVPPGTIADVPGYGSSQLGEAYAIGDLPLIGVTVDNLLDVRIDGVARLSEAGWATLLTRVGGLEIEVPSRLTADGEVRFEAGTQFLDGPRLAEYLTFRGDAETQLEAFPRIQQVITGLLDAIAAEPELLEAIFRDGAPMFDTTDPELLREVVAQLAAAERTELNSVTTLTLPVSALGSGREDVYRVDAARVDELVEERFKRSRPNAVAGVGRRVQILNGNGSPGIGQQVAEEISDGGYRIVLTGNADRFTYEQTRIILYGDSEEHLAMGRDIQEQLGVGEIERAATPQSVVDATIVVGMDFPSS